MYSKILKELKGCTDCKSFYEVLRYYKRSFDLSYNQIEYILGQINLPEGV